MYRLTATIIAFLLWGGWAFDYEILSDWELKRVSGTIEFSYRDVRVGDTLETKEMRMRFPINASPEEIVPYFRNASLFMQWSPDVDDCRVIEDAGSTWMMYKFYDMPWPIAERDIVTLCQLTQSDSLTHLKITGVPGGVPQRKGVRRITAYEGQWYIRQVSASASQVEFRTVQLNRQTGFRGLQDNLVEKSFVKSIEMLRMLLERE